MSLQTGREEGFQEIFGGPSSLSSPYANVYALQLLLLCGIMTLFHASSVPQSPFLSFESD